MHKESITRHGIMNHIIPSTIENQNHRRNIFSEDVATVWGCVLG